MDHTILSGMENTPELQKALELARNNGRGDPTFSTTLGHIVTKILDLDITFTLPDATEYKPFTTVGEVNTFFGIKPNQYFGKPNRQVMDHIISNIYRGKVEPKENEVLIPQREFVENFFTINVWGILENTSHIDTLFFHIRELAEMEIEGINEYVCSDIIDWIVKNTIGLHSDIIDWNELSTQQKEECTIDRINKGKITEYFVDLVVDLPWRRNPNNPYKHMMDRVKQQIQSLYMVGDGLDKTLHGVQRDSFRNTRYI